MRITGGILRGRQIKLSPGVIRPAMDRMRESVFAVLGDLSGCSFLDIFCGSGIISLEAASRGAASIEAVEMDPIKRETLLLNVQISPVRVQCRFMPAELYVKRAKRPFDIIFCDPPFNYKYKWELVQAIAASALSGEGSRLLLHRPREDYCKFFNEGNSLEADKLSGEGRGRFVLYDSREYGRSIVDFFKFFLY